MILRNSIYNLIGLGIPALVALVTIPALIAALGSGSFGVLTIIWAVVSYFGLFDLGLGRAVTQQVAAAIGAGDKNSLRGIIGTSFWLMVGLGLLSGLVLFLATPWIVGRLADGRNLLEITRAFEWMALAMPAIVITSFYRGILEALGRFALVNMIRFPMGIFTFLGPLAVVWMGWARLDVITAVLSVGRIIACGVHAYFAWRALPAGIGSGSIRRDMVRPLLTFGGWLSVSNIISPLMSYIDRFLIGMTISAAAVAYYATPQELIMRIGFIPGAVAAVLFPVFAASAHAGNMAQDRMHVRRYSLLILAMMAPPSLAVFFFAHQLLSWWITPEFADNSAVVLQIMSIAALGSGLAQVPFTMLQGRGRADITAKLHLVEFPIYLGLLYLLLINYGLIGAALAWLFRIVIDMAALYYFNLRMIEYQDNTLLRRSGKIFMPYNRLNS